MTNTRCDKTACGEHLGLVRSRPDLQFISQVLDGFSALASLVLPHQPGQAISLWTWLCVRGYCHVETEKGTLFLLLSYVVV